MDKYYFNGNSNYLNNNSKLNNKRSASVEISRNYINDNRHLNRSVDKTYQEINRNKYKNSVYKKDNFEDYQKLSKKFYSIIINLQEELTKQTIRNYNLLEENINLKQELSELQYK